MSWILIVVIMKFGTLLIVTSDGSDVSKQITINDWPEDGITEKVLVEKRHNRA